MKKQSILNLVNSILLLCTLLFSVISFAWYSNTTTITPDLSFGAKDIGDLENLVMLKFNDNGVDKSITNNLSVLSQSASPSTADASVIYTTFEMGVIDDLGYLKDTNCVYYCLPVSVSEGNDSVVVNLAYSTTGMNEVKTSETGTVPLHFNIKEENGAATDNKYPLKLMETYTELEDGQNKAKYFHATAASYENFIAPTKEGDDPIHTYLTYDCATSLTAPGDMTHGLIHSLFNGETTTTKKSGYMVSAAGTNPEDKGVSNAEIAPPALEEDTSVYYVYIRVYPNLDNYDNLAMLMLDHMPFYMSFGLKLYIGLPQGTNN